MTNRHTADVQAHFHSLDALRGLAALIIVIFHISWWNPAMAVHFMKSAYLMVDLFFVLSGFVIFHSYASRLNSLPDIARFIWLRLGRLLPLHLFFLLVFLAIEMAKYFASHEFGIMPNTPPFSQNNLATFSSNLLLLHSLGLHNHLSFNIPSWSISVEFYTYLAFASAIYLARTTWVYVVLAVLFVLIGMCELLGTGKHNLDVNFDYGIFRCFAGFFLGTLVYMVHLHSREKSLKLSPTLAMAVISSPWSVAAAAVGFLALKRDGLWDFAFPPIAAALILSLATFPGSSLAGLLRRAPFAWLGRISYSIYMAHFAVIWMLAQVMRLFLQPPLTVSPFNGEEIMDPPIPVGLAFMAVAITFVLLLSQFTYTRIEVPFREKSRALLKSWRAGKEPAQSRSLLRSASQGMHS